MTGGVTLPTGTLPERALAAAERTKAPDVVIAYAEDGRRGVVSGGTASRSPGTRVRMRYEVGSVSKTFVVLLLADLVERGVVDLDDHAAAHLRLPDRRPRATLFRLATHTSGLPRLPPDLYWWALPRWSTNPYAGYSQGRLLGAFARSHPRGRRWHYSNFGMAVLGHALAHATRTRYGDLLAEHVLHPLGLRDTGLWTTDGDATGHRADGDTPVPAVDMGGFAPAGAVRATPEDLLGYLESHLEPATSPLATALHRTRTPTIGPGLGHPHTHALTWFRHPTDRGPAYFHTGATLGQQAFLGFRPATRTALAAVTTRRYSHRDPFVATVHELLTACR